MTPEQGTDRGAAYQRSKAWHAGSRESGENAVRRRVTRQQAQRTD